MRNLALSFTTAIALLVSTPLAAAETVAGLAEAFASRSVRPGSTVESLNFSIDHMSVTLSSGIAAPIEAGGQQIGLFFKGKGLLSYQSADPLEKTVTAFNVKKATDLRAVANDKGLLIQDSFEQMALYANPEGLPKIQPGGTASLDEAFKKHRDVFDRDQYASAAHLFIKQRLDTPSAKIARAEFSGGAEHLVYLKDPLIAKSETLYSLYRSREIIRDLKKLWFPVVLSDQPIGRDRRKFVEPPYILTDLTYTLIASGNDATLSVTETLAPLGAAQTVYLFDFYNKTYDTSYRARTYQLKSVTDASGKELSYDHVDNHLVVGLPAPVKAGEAFKLQFEISGDFLIRPSGDSYWQLGTEPWFPQPDLNGQFYTIHSTVKVKKPFIAFAPGETIRRFEEGELNGVENRIDKPVQFAVVLAGKYFFEEEVSDGVTIRIASYAMKNPAAMKKLSNLAAKMIKFYEPFLGPFPFKEFNIIEINEYGYGQAPPATMFITQEAFSPLMGDMNQIFSQGINHRFAHEIAHQYWGHVVKMGSLEEQWLTESFAEYSSSLVIKRLKGNDAYQAMMSRWKANAKDSAQVSSIALANRIRNPGDPFDAFLNRTHLIYDKGAWLLSRLHKEIGDDMFLSFLRSCQGILAWRYATTEDAIVILARLTKKDFRPFFEQNFWGTGMPQ